MIFFIFDSLIECILLKDFNIIADEGLQIVGLRSVFMTFVLRRKWFFIVLNGPGLILTVSPESPSIFDTLYDMTRVLRTNSYSHSYSFISQWSFAENLHGIILLNHA